MQIDHQRAALRYQNKVNNAQGHFFEQAIKAACALYASHGRATADKTPEPVSYTHLAERLSALFVGRRAGRGSCRPVPVKAGRGRDRAGRGRQKGGGGLTPSPPPQKVHKKNRPALFCKATRSGFRR